MPPPARAYDAGSHPAPELVAPAKALRLLYAIGAGVDERKFPHQLSGGEQQRVAIARALATGNPVVLGDEPTGELDFRTGVQILELLRTQADAGKTVLVVTHTAKSPGAPTAWSS